MSGIPETRTLYDILPPKSAASGKEFARTVNLLLFHDARRRGESLTLFDDRAGDFHGLDAFQQEGQRIAIGFQHKFYPTPLSDNHRQEIEESLLKTLKFLKEKEKGLGKWVLVTPQDPVESATRKSGGDVTWFAGLSKKHKLKFDIEHWGHSQLQSLFIETPAIGLYYYPELFPNGVSRRKTIQQLRSQYNKTLKSEHGRIEFVGMSVYTQESARTVPMEQIYIPLSLIPDGAGDDEQAIPRHNPFDLLSSGTHHVVLGDPGSGKTTLLRFLALVGRSEALQRRYTQQRSKGPFQYQEDDRLPILITLRRYADALKKDDNLSLLDYMRANIAADFSIPDLSLEFLEYHLETGRALLLFDGLDELPNPEFKRKIRNRVQNLGEHYPGNTILVTSRIYGYHEAFPFDKEGYRHHRLAKLEMAEIECFVKDWYHARFERSKDCKEYMQSLLTILRNNEHEAIRELARNPLLLTIIVLVHRLDAVLPDERHVLYQKCTETLLNTWHTGKFHEMDRLHRAKVDRLNMQRMQGVAYWMQQRMGATEAGRQAVVPYGDLHQELTRHIGGEKPPNPDYAPEDIATAFIEFVQDRAGLLVEIGDRQFSFVHLTFQEYLTAGHIKTITEPLALDVAWQQEIAPHCADPRWREVIRLLVASYGANQSQEMLVEWMLGLEPEPQVSLLLTGLYLDGVAAAQMVLEQIFERLLETIVATTEQALLANQFSQLRACLARDGGAANLLENAARSRCARIKDEEGKTRLRLTLSACGLAPETVWTLCGPGTRREQALISLFFAETLAVDLRLVLLDDFRLLQAVNELQLLTCPYGCFLSILGWSQLGCSGQLRYRQMFFSLFATLVYTFDNGPLPYLTSYCGLFSALPGLRSFVIFLQKYQSRELTLDLDRSNALDLFLPLNMDPSTINRTLASSLAKDRARNRASDMALGSDRACSWDQDLDSDRILGKIIDQAIGNIPLSGNQNDLRRQLWGEPKLLGATVEHLTTVFGLQPSPFWLEALKTSRLRELPRSQPLVDPAVWRETLKALKRGDVSEEIIWLAACQLFMDGALYLVGFHRPDEGWLRRELHYTDEALVEHLAAAAETEQLLAEIAEQTRDRPEPALQIAHCIRDLAYGDETRADDLQAMVRSADPEYHQIFVECCWLPTEEERQREEEEAKKRKRP